MKYIISIIIIIVVAILLFKIPKRMKKIETIKELTFSYTVGYAMNADVSYKIECQENCTITIKPNGIPLEEAKTYQLSKKQITEIIAILNKYKVSSWDGFNKSDKNVLDGNSFHFYLKENNDSSISASGYMRYPKDYRTVKSELEAIFDKIEK